MRMAAKRNIKAISFSQDNGKYYPVLVAVDEYGDAWWSTFEAKKWGDWQRVPSLPKLQGSED